MTAPAITLPQSKEHAAAERVLAALAADATLHGVVLPQLFSPRSQLAALEADAASNEYAVAVEVGTLLPDDAAHGEPAAGRAMARVNIWVFARPELTDNSERRTHERVCALQDAVIASLMHGFCNTDATATHAPELTEVQEVDTAGTKLSEMAGRVITLSLPIFYT